jgi:hypothetical protein
MDSLGDEQWNTRQSNLRTICAVYSVLMFRTDGNFNSLSKLLFNFYICIKEENMGIRPMETKMVSLEDTSPTSCLLLIMRKK